MGKFIGARLGMQNKTQSSKLKEDRCHLLSSFE